MRISHGGKQHATGCIWLSGLCVVLEGEGVCREGGGVVL